jgi:uncharacterized protein (TIGR02996 family)
VSDREALLRAIIEDPDDDAPRLIYADWLDEHGNADRAEFIRLQCDIYSTPMPEKHWSALVDRARTLLGNNEKLWMQELPDRTPSWSTGPFYRGFIRQAKFESWSVLEGNWEELFAATPLTFVTVQTITPIELDEFLSRTETRFLQNVYLGIGGRYDAAVTQIARSPAVAKWQVLSLSPQDGDELTKRGSNELVSSPFLSNLRGLYLPTRELTTHVHRSLKDRFHDVLS